MKRIKLILICFSILMMFTTNAGAVESLVKSIVTGCEIELTSYCSKVTPGEGLVLSCLYAHNDKISGRCECSLYDAAAQLERFVATLSYVVNECEDDLEKHCGSVQAGQGRLAECLLEKNKDKISNRYTQAINEVDLEFRK